MSCQEFPEDIYHHLSKLIERCRKPEALDANELLFQIEVRLGQKTEKAFVPGVSYNEFFRIKEHLKQDQQEEQMQTDDDKLTEIYDVKLGNNIRTSLHDKRESAIQRIVREKEDFITYKPNIRIEFRKVRMLDDYEALAPKSEAIYALADNEGQRRPRHLRRKLRQVFRCNETFTSN